MWGVNQRLQTVQAVVANRLLDRVTGWIDRRIEIANRLDVGLADVAPGPAAATPTRAPQRIPAVHRPLRAA